MISFQASKKAGESRGAIGHDRQQLYISHICLNRVFGSRAFLFKGHKNSKNIGLLKKSTRNLNKEGNISLGGFF